MPLTYEGLPIVKCNACYQGPNLCQAHRHLGCAKIETEPDDKIVYPDPLGLRSLEDKFYYLKVGNEENICTHELDDKSEEPRCRK